MYSVKHIDRYRYTFFNQQFTCLHNRLREKENFWKIFKNSIKRVPLHFIHKVFLKGAMNHRMIKKTSSSVADSLTATFTLIIPPSYRVGRSVGEMLCLKLVPQCKVMMCRCAWHNFLWGSGQSVPELLPIFEILILISSDDAGRHGYTHHNQW